MAIDVEHLGSGHRIELYIKPTCPYCREAMEYYDAHNVPYVLHNAQRDAAARARMLEYTKGDPTVPAIVVDGEYVQSGWGHPPRG